MRCGTGGRSRVLLLGVPMLLLGLVGPSSAAPHAWGRWEQVLHSTREHPNPYGDVVLKVTYSGPRGQVLRAYGFWDGGEEFRIRCAFPSAGLWKWRTTCSDPLDSGLHGRSGEVRVQRYSGKDPLYRHGFLRVSSNRRYLTHADGTPFLWVGDTAWAAPLHATAKEWEEYLADRAGKGFTVTQIAPASSWAGKQDAEGNPPFQSAGLERWNPAYWRGFEAKIKAANDHGLVVMLVGLMEPTDRYPDARAAVLFARQLVARLYGSFVVFSPSFDSPYMALGDEVGAAIRDATSVHLVTQHPGTDLPAAEQYHRKVYADVSGVQTGAGWGTDPLSTETASRNALEWCGRLYGLTPPKPLVNLESRYDSGFNQKQMARLPRSCGYWSLLSGAVGYTYGCAGVWGWGGPIGDDPQGRPWGWREGMHQESSADVGRMARLLGGLEWWTLQPKPEWVVGQPELWSRHVAVAASPRGDLVVAYAPDNRSVTLKPGGELQVTRGKWANPKTGELVPAVGTRTTAGELSFQRPQGWEDAVLVLSPGGRLPARLPLPAKR